MTLKRAASGVAVLAFLALAVPAHADPDACFDWTCNANTLECEFDASCSGDSPLDFRWTWGDGSAVESHWQNPLASHTFPAYTQTSYVTLSVGYMFIGYYDATCQIRIYSPIGPWQDTFSGTCT